MKKSVLLLVIVLASITVGSAFAITIRLAGDVTVDGTLDVAGTITIPNPTIDNLQGQIINLGGMGLSTPINAATLDGLDSTDLGKSNQSCQAGQLVTGFDATGNEICKEIKIVRDLMNGLGSVSSMGQLISADDGTAIAIGSDGNPIISYVEVGEFDLMVIHCTNPSCSLFDAPLALITTDQVGFASSIAIGSVDGFPVITYVDSTNSDLMLVHCKNVTCSGVEGVGFDTPVMLADGNGSTTFVEDATSIAIGTDNNPVIAFYLSGTPTTSVRLIHCTSVSCSSADPIRVLDSDAIGFPSVAIGDDNNPIVSYIAGNDDLHVVHCTNQICSSITSNVIDSSGAEFVNNSIAIGSDGFPVISYSTTSLLKFVHCKNMSCSGSEGVGFDTPQTFTGFAADNISKSIAIDLDGFPVLAVKGGGASLLQIIYCKDVFCSNFEIVDTINDSAVAISLAIGNDGLPVISSYETTNDVLQVTRAGGILLGGTVIPGG